MLRRGIGFAGVSLALLLGAPRSHAEPTSAQRAAAEGLFQRAAELMDAERYTEACEKFQASQQLDPAIGTMLYLADCYDRAGQTASAWALFQEAAQKALRGGQADRERIAKERAADLQVRLSLLELRVEKVQLAPDFEVSLNGVRVPNASLNTPLPVDPGTTRIEARAPGKKSWSATVTIPAGPVSRVQEIPALPTLPPSAAAPKARSERDAVRSDGSSTQRTLGYVTGAAGIVALAVGGIFAYRAYDQNKRSKAECSAEDTNACTRSGVELREDAKASASLATIATVSGGALVAGGLVILLTAPVASERANARAALPEGVTLELGGVF